MSDLAYWYDYDSRGRMTLKKLPGVKAAKMVYDPADRLVGEQSAHHADGQWRLYGYDACGRQVVSADFAMTDQAAAAYASSCHTSVLESGGAFAGYTMPGAPSYGKTVTASYYDGYDFITVNSLSSDFNWSATGDAFSYASPGKASAGLLTGVYTGKGYESYYYNLDGQLMESYGTGFNNVRANCTYTYRGDPEKKWWTLPDGTVRKLEWIYDTSGRLTGMKTYMNGSEAGASVAYAYDSGGRLVKEDYGSVSRSRAYDVAGRPTASTVSGASGVMEILAYDAAGRISSKTTKGGTYSFVYDSRGRLKSAVNGSSTSGFSVEYDYDDRSNSYDASGRLVSDASRGITHILYDNDGRPVSVKFSGGTEQSMEWDNYGNHLSTRYIKVSYTGKPSDRLVRSYTGDGRVIDNNIESYALYPGGYYKDGSYYRYIKDYEGNNVAVLDGSGGLVQSTDYYPYGEPWREPSGQPWLYSGNERLLMDGINEYDFNARRCNSRITEKKERAIRARK